MKRGVWQDHCGRFVSYATPSELIEVDGFSPEDPFGSVVSSVARVKGPLCQASIAVGSGPADTSSDHSENEQWDITVNGVTRPSLGDCIISFDSCRGEDLGNVLRDHVSNTLGS